MSEHRDESQLHGHWVHSDDEDSGDEIILRSPDFDFPPRRMPRESVTLEEGGACTTGTPGPADRNEPTKATWSVDGDQLTVSGSSRLSGRFQIVRVEAEKLVLRRLE